MPSNTKIVYYISSALVTAVSVGVMGFGMSGNWATTTMECTRIGSDFTNGSAEITWQLLDGYLYRVFCPSFGGEGSFEVIPAMLEAGVTFVALHGTVLCLLALCLLFSACSILISLYNSVSNPYATYMGPVGVYVCSSLSACLAVVVLIIYAVNVAATNMAEELVKGMYDDADLRNTSSEMKLGYFLIIPYIVLSLTAIVVIYMYDHAAYTHRREQQRPTEDAPKEIMMY
ncbi:clarin-3 [Plectropomus leopardus]|uniref:clarin-3 n=1 Tax=Plectropomus leopardus TaxID=160734 RepID=UPI001C4DB081|nr:clarin-3 [Plectropomus leopardus]